MLKKILFRPGVNRENTRYAAEVMGAGGSMSVANATAGWYEVDKVRFRSGSPEKIGGWTRISANTFLGICRSLFAWVTLGSADLLGVGTNVKFYIGRGGQYYDITPLRDTATLTNPFATTSGSPIVTVTDTAHGCDVGDYVTFTAASTVGGLNMNGEFVVATVPTVNTFTVVAASNASSTVAAGGGAVTAAYQIHPGLAYQVPLVGWGAGPWGGGPWGIGAASTQNIRLWSQRNFGEDLVFAYRGSPIYYWDASAGTSVRAVELTGSDVPTVQSFIYVSDISRFVFAFGCNDIGSAVQNPMLIRWSDQEDATNWTPSATTQAGGITLSDGSELITCIQTRQEIVVWTNSALYSLQYLGPPAIWETQILGSNISIISPNSAASASGRIFWMGIDKFYIYDGRVQTLRCDLRQYIFGDINLEQLQQICCGTNEGFNEVWWFYPSRSSVTNDRYVVYNYLEDIWYYGTIGRTAWLDTGLRDYPLAATYNHNLVNHEQGVDDNETGTTTAIEAYIESAEFDIEDGHNFGFIWRVLPDLTFRGSTNGSNPECTMTLIPMQNSGSGFNNPRSTAGTSNATIQRIATAPIEEFTGQVYIRIRGRQIIFKISSNKIGTTWQLGAPRIDIKPDGRRGNT